MRNFNLQFWNCAGIWIRWDRPFGVKQVLNFQEVSELNWVSLKRSRFSYKIFRSRFSLGMFLCWNKITWQESMKPLGYWFKFSLKWTKITVKHVFKWFLFLVQNRETFLCVPWRIASLNRLFGRDSGDSLENPKRF